MPQRPWRDSVPSYLDHAKWRYLWTGVRKRFQQCKRCPCCDADQSDPLDHKYVYSLHRCRECGVCYKYPTETRAEMERFYQQDYGRNDTRLSRRLPESAELEKLLADRFAGTLIDYSRVVELLVALGLKSGARVLDYGASWGYGVWQLRQAGFNAEGFEISRPRAEFGAKLGVRIHQELKGAEAGFDAVYSSHVLEHLPNPLAALREQLQLTKEGGFVAAHTPSACDAFRRVHPALFHLLWGLNHPVLLSDVFIHKNWPHYPCFISSGTDRHLPASLARWNPQDHFTDDLSQAELLVILRSQPPRPD